MISDERVAAMLPRRGFMAKYVRTKSKETDAALVFHLGAVLSILSTIAPIQLRFQLGGDVHAATWIMLVGDAGNSRKTTCVNFAVDLLREAVPELVGGVPGSKEECKEQLIAQPQQLIPYPELGNLFSTTSVGYLAGLRDLFTELWDARIVERNLVHRQESAQEPRLNLLGGIAPAFIELYTGEGDWMNGHMSRWITLSGGRDPRRINALPKTRNAADTAWFVQRIREIHATPVGVCDGMTADAAALYTKWYEDNQKKYEDTPMKWVRSSMERSQNVAVKGMLLCSLDIGEAGRGLARWHITKECVEFGIALAEFALESIIEIVGGLAGSQYGKHRLAVLAAIPYKGRPPRTTGEIYTHCTPKIDPRDCDRVLRGLIAEGLISEVNISLGDTRYIQTRTKAEVKHPVPMEVPRVDAQDLAEFGISYAGAGARESTAVSSSSDTPSSSAASTGVPLSASAAVAVSYDSDSDDGASSWDEYDIGDGNMDVPDDD